MITNLQNTQIHYADRNNRKNNPNFKGAETAVINGLRFLNNSPAIGACAVDLGSMVIPRTIVDTKKRGIDAGTETGIREGSSTTNHALVGVVGLGAATIVSQGINHKYGVTANKIFANNDSIDVFKSFWIESKHNPEEYYKKALSSLSGLNGTNADNKISEGISSIAKDLTENKTLTKDLKRSIVARIVKETGAEGSFTISELKKAAKNTAQEEVKPKVVTDSINVIIENMHSLGESFKTVTAEELKDPKKIEDALKKVSEYTDKLKTVKTASALLGLAVTCTIGCSVQPINTYLTKKRTGKEGFVGVEGREPDKTNGFKLMKLAASGVMGLLAFKTIGGGFKGVLNKIQFSSMLPNLNQFKMIYGMTIMSRFMSARDKNELRESTIKDFLGFANWLILGGMVSKLVARGLGKGGELVNNSVAKEGKNAVKYGWEWLTKASVKTYDQVLLKGLADAGKEVIKDGKALGFGELMKLADKATKAKVGKIALAQVAGYLYSGVVLGFGIAKLNIFITGKVQKAQKDKQPTKPASPDAKVMFFAQNNDDKKSIFAKIKA